MNSQLITTILFELLDLGIRMTENRHGDHEKYVQLREQLRKELVEEANTPPTPLTPDERVSTPETNGNMTRIDGPTDIVGGQGTEHL